ncbi:aminotransferase class I/II-fold pyridoxal phosphate-dependent enzyme [Scytonema hofmannii FACHB-248]|uniref:Aminotransferase class I/II-fold pyridoxal phosphate-dependent enzyme n=1 Tax=Scytonema hofmannii FACHB-248 TaxID=1842502 RepID=A0ABR8GJE3_9CYAN|nr:MULTISPECIES: aminotransferase class I/II-fold pyridoxal phosphate-dependent enzyme [Nostocales]MBD2603453.1 aminotransferase class I/II-fold pyridoxal phosphate-dependent enzyme [Scytonema hofmannii FACHB-248]
MQPNTIPVEDEQKSGIQFHKSFKTPDQIPEKGIRQAIKLMQHGRLYRYNFSDDLSNYSNSDELNDEDEQLATEVAKLEYEFSLYTKHKYVVGVNSCGSAIFLALKAGGVKYGDKVLTNAFTFTAVPSSIVHTGGIPIYVECNSGYVIDIEDLKRKIADHLDAKFFVLSHMRGHISDLDTVRNICEQAGIYLIEDCAHSLGAEWDGKLVGYHGQIACFSTQSYKLLNSGEGGLIATNNEELAAYCILAAGSYEKLYKKHLARPVDDNLFEQMKPHVPNFSLRMSNLTAAVLRPQIEFLENKISQGRQKYHRLVEILNSVRNIYIPSPLEQVKHAPDSLQFNLLGLTSEQVDKFVQQTSERGVAIQIFGRADNSRYYKNWQYSFTEIPTLEKTESIISSACDIRLPSNFDFDDLNLIGYLMKDVLYKILREENHQDYANGLTDYFENIQEVRSKYDNWVSFYDQEHYDNGWTILLNHIAYTLISYLKKDDLILDIGCGTGLLGRELSSYGFKNLQGLDISQQSLDILKDLDIYNALHLEELGNTLSFADNTFDALVSTGVFTRNQVPLETFEELIRVLKPGGIFAVVLRVEDDDLYYKPIKNYCAINMWQEVLKARISVLKSCNHELVILQKQSIL